MSIQATSEVSARLATDLAVSRTEKPQGLGDVFMQMLLKQLSNQDPLQSMTGTDFVIQLAQLSTLEQLQEMNSSLRNYMDMQQLAQASQLIGKTVQGLDTSGLPVEGVVSAARFMNGMAILNVGSQSIPLNQVQVISDTSNISGGRA